tara:strand:+ start:9457 stop:9858 length:402 start_codon:yes stop_codon:yes gene_type:complete
MDIDKSLYMADFLKLREELGKVERHKVKDVLFSNLYDEMNLKEHNVEVIQSLGIDNLEEPMESKSILLNDSKDSSIIPKVLPELFPDLPDESSEQSIPEVKIVKIEKDENPDKIVEKELKQIIIDPKYVAKDN